MPTSRKSIPLEGNVQPGESGNQIPHSPQVNSLPTSNAVSGSSHTSRDSIETIIHPLSLNTIKETMAQALNFKPARYFAGKISYVSYYILDPRSNQFKRQRIKLNHVPEAERERFASEMINAINARLYAGWNPIVEEVAARGSDSMEAALRYYSSNFMPSRPDSVRSYTSIIKAFSSWVNSTSGLDRPCSAFDHTAAVRFMKDITARKQLAPRTYNNYLTVLHTIFNVLVEYQFALENPFKGIPKKKARGKNREAIPDEVLAKIIEKVQQTDPRFMIAIHLLYYCGIRPTEITKLRIADFRFDQSVVLLRHDQTKNGRDASITIPSDIIIDIMHHCDRFPPHYYLFGKNRNLEPGPDQLNPRRLAKHWDRLRRRLNLPPKYKLYSMKDTGATYMAGELSPNELKNQMRHQNLGITEIYIQKAKPVANENIMKLKRKI